jgi:hypothetical protein
VIGDDFQLVVIKNGDLVAGRLGFSECVEIALTDLAEVLLQESNKVLGS